jgi:hypothetical protein
VRNVTFSEWQPVYAEHGIATIPCSPSKRPLVRNPQKFGCPASAEIATKFPDAQTFGYYTGRKSGITVLDVDIADENVLATALDRHGPSPIIVRTGSGKFHALYRHNGERRSIRPWGEELEIDILGATGLCIAPPSLGVKGQYQIIEGSLDDLASCRSCGGWRIGFTIATTPVHGRAPTGRLCERVTGGIPNSGVN